MINIHDDAGLADLRVRLRIDPDCLRRFRNAFYKHHRDADEALAELPADRRAEFAASVACHSLQLQERHDSRLDGASKLLFRTARGHRIETVVLRIASGRTALCVSSQVGCAARCAFCATGQLGLAVDLSADEILDQVAQANRILRAERRAVRNVVFMGMGEPLHNESAVYRAAEVLQSRQCFALAPGRILISTVGIPDAMVRCARRLPQVGLALSLHSARQEVRERLIPLARRYSLPALRTAIAEVNGLQQSPVMIEYLMLGGLTDTDADLDALGGFLEGLPVHVNLIPYNPIAAAPDLQASSPERVRQFAGALADRGHKVTVRRSLGADITAACGQLALGGVNGRSLAGHHPAQPV